MEPIIYRDHVIQSCEGMPGNYEFFMDGGQSVVCGSIEDCKKEINEKVREWEEYQLRRDKRLLELQQQEYQLGI